MYKILTSLLTLLIYTERNPPDLPVLSVKLRWDIFSCADFYSIEILKVVCADLKNVCFLENGRML